LSRSPYTGGVKSFKLVVESCFKHVVIMGGPRRKTSMRCLNGLKDVSKPVEPG
jgi:DhnA family fructose-bisphosphate aldolase class Ia